MSTVTDSSIKTSYDSIDEILSDPAELAFLDEAEKEQNDGKEIKASSEFPAVLEHKARMLSTQPFTGNPPHHGANAQEVLNTALVRRFAELSYDKVAADVFKSTDKPELGSLLESLKAAQQDSASAEQA